MTYLGRNAASPRREYLRKWAAVCRFIDAEPYRSIWFPFQSQVPDRPAPPISARLLERMAHFGLVAHRTSDCAWRLSANWRKILDRLAQGLDDEDEPDKPNLLTDPFVADYGVDTMYVNILADDLPARLAAMLTDLKQQAQAEDNTVVTPWVYDGAPLSMHKSGKGTTGKRGVSWGYILRNESVEVKLRKSPISGIIAMVRLGSQPLWVHGPKVALDMMRSLLQAMWLHEGFDQVGFQLSQIHLCADIANFPLQVELLSRLVSHSLSHTLHLHAVEDLAESTVSYDEDDLLLYDDPPDEWDDPGDISQDEWADDDDDDDDDDEASDEDDEHPAWAEGGAGLHFYGKHIQGFSFSPRSPLSAAWYDKAREEQKSQKLWMRPIHEAGGWQTGMPLTRVEHRFKRGVTRELEALLGHKGERWFDDPWVAIAHQADLWAFAVGLPPELAHLADEGQRGWMRLALPSPTDKTSTRWETDPTWLLLQRIPFGIEPPNPLQRTKHLAPDLAHIDAEILGLFKTRAVLRAVYLHGDAELSRELEAFDDRMAEQAADKGTDFAEDVRERARMMGKPLPLRSVHALPIKSKKKGA
jgi:hypothetical protein